MRISADKTGLLKVTNSDLQLDGGFIFPDTVTHIGDGAFKGCNSLTKVTIPDSVTHIGNEAFSMCKGLKQVTIPEPETFGPDPANSDNPFNSDDLDATVTDAVTESTEPNQTKGTLGSLPSADEAHLTPFLLRRIEVPNEIVYFVLYNLYIVLLLLNNTL